MTPPGDRRSGAPRVALQLAAAAVVLLAAVAAAQPRLTRPAAADPPPSAARIAPRAGALADAAADDTPLPLFDEGDAPSPSPSAGPRLVQGPMETVLYGGADAAPPAATAEALRLLAHKLDLTRDLALGDRVRLLLGADGALDYAEVDGARGRVRLFRAGAGDGADAFVDEAGVSLRALLLRTPLAHPRLTSGFGPRLHPLLGYTRLHAGVDFAAAVGTPALAAADGVVEAASWRGGYGRVVVLRHVGGLETLYAHLSGWPAGVSPGAVVRQGETIGFTGHSGLATGPHLHFEVRRGGAPVDPAGATLAPAPPSPARLARVEAVRRRVDALAAAARG